MLERDVLVEMVSHCIGGLPEEACGLLGGLADDTGHARCRRCYPARNAASSARVYEVDARDHLRADRDAETRGEALVGVFHSHTHTAAYPSPTDLAQAPDPAWHYVLVSLQHPAPAVRSYRLAGGKIVEEAVVVHCE